MVNVKLHQKDNTATKANHHNDPNSLQIPKAQKPKAKIQCEAFV